MSERLGAPERLATPASGKTQAERTAEYLEAHPNAEQDKDMAEIMAEAAAQHEENRSVIAQNQLEIRSSALTSEPVPKLVDRYGHEYADTLGSLGQVASVSTAGHGEKLSEISNIDGAPLSAEIDERFAELEDLARRERVAAERLAEYAKLCEQRTQEFRRSVLSMVAGSERRAE